MAYQRKRAGADWWDATWNPVGGCLPVSAGCKNCYAAKLAGTQQEAHRIALYDGVTDRKRDKHAFNGKLTVLPPEHPAWLWPLKWSGAAHPVLATASRV